MPRIQTTVVGSYPVPDWLVASPSEQALIDATRVVIDTQEQCGVDVVCDGELYRFDINHPETNGMIEYFVRPMDGITQRFSLRRPDRLPLEQRHEVPHPSAGHGGRARSATAASTCRWPARAPRRWPRKTFKFTRHRPAHAGQDADRQALRRRVAGGACDRRRAGRAGAGT